MSDSVDDASQFNCETLAEIRGKNRVLLSSGAAKEFWSLDKRDQARMVANMDLWVEDRTLADTQFNGNEGRAKNGRMLLAFKIRKIRCYGFVCSLQKRKTFVIVDVDPAKKTNKGKPRILDRAKIRVINFEEKHGEKYE